MHSSESSAAVRSRGFLLVAALLIPTHIALVNHFLPFSEVFSNEPIHGVDYDLHIGQVFRVVNALDHWGKTWLYDTQLLAGQPEGTITDSGSKGWELYTFLLHRLGVPTGTAFNTFILLIMGACPFLIYAAARLFELTPETSLLAAAMSACLWFFDSHLHWVWFVGMISWTGAACLSPLVLALFYRWIHRPRIKSASVMAVSLSLSLLVHPYVFFVLTPPMLVLYVTRARDLRVVDHACVLGMAALAVISNVYWLHNALKHWHYILDSAVYAQADPKYLLFDLFDLLYSGSDTGIIGTRTGFRFLCLGLAIAGLVVWRAKRDPRWLPFICSIVPLYAVAYFGGFVPGMQQTQPYRQVSSAMLLTTFPAAAYVGEVLRNRALHGALNQWARFAAAILVLCVVRQLLVSQVLYYFPEVSADTKDRKSELRSAVSKYGFPWRPEMPSNLPYRLPHSNDFEYGAEEVLDWIEAHIPHGSRVLVEGTVLGERLAWRGNHEIFGGFFERNVQHSDANYFRTHRGIEPNAADFEHYLRTYAIGWVVTERPQFDAFKQLLERVATTEGRQVYRVRLKTSPALEGGGVVTASANTIEVSGSDPNQPLLLSYHWHEALRCKPDCTLERAPVDIDRVGFIRVPAPHPSGLKIWNSYQTW